VKKQTEKQRKKASDIMKNSWKTGKIKPKVPWNKGKSTKKLKKSRPKVKIEEYKCLECEKLFVDWKIFKRKCCSRQCAGRFQFRINNHLNNIEIQKKSSESKKGKSMWWKGDKHWNWLGGKSFEPYGIKFNKELKNKIRNRFDKHCVECGYFEDELGYKLHIHHIDYNKKNNNENNLIALCRNCHMQTNFKRSDWTNYFKEKIL